MLNLKVGQTAVPIEIVDTPKRLAEVVDYLSTQDRFAWDHETRSVDFAQDPGGALRKVSMRSDLVSFSTRHQAFVVVLGLLTVPAIDPQVAFDLIRPMMEDNTIVHDGWNCSFDMHAMANYGVWVQNYCDLMIAAWMLDENRSASLKERCRDVEMELNKFPFKEYWKCRAQIDGTMPRKARAKKWSQEDLERFEAEYLTYSAEDSIATAFLSPLYMEQIEADRDLRNLFWNLRNPGVRTLFSMERRGVPLDTSKLQSKRVQCEHDMLEQEKKTYEEAGTHFALNSPKDIGRVLYEEMGLPVYKYTSGKGAPSTDAATLARLGQDGYTVAKELAEYRRLAKLYSTYLGPTAKLQVLLYPWGHLHPSFNGTGTKTGRLSCSDPNMQQIPHNTARNYHIRDLFTASCSSYVLIGGDYSQIELRIMAHMSQDPMMVAEYRKDAKLQEALLKGESLKEAENKYGKSDIHEATANTCNTTRDMAKAINFGMLYGMGSEKLAGTLTTANWDRCIEDGLPWDSVHDVITPDEGYNIIQAFFNRYSGVKAYQNFIFERVKQQGFITTRWGLKRRLPDVLSNDNYLVHAACRQAVNLTIQGHVGELMLHNMNLIEGSIRSQRKDIQEAVMCLKDCRYRLFLQVHDEILGEGPKRYADQILHALTVIFQCPQVCTEAYPFYGYRVPLLFEAKVGETWALVH